MDSNSFCTFRWTDSLVNLSRGEVRSCCKTPAFKISADELERYGSEVFDNSQYIQQRRSEMFQGIKHSDCSYCWKLEDKNIAHPRLQSENAFQFFPKDWSNHLRTPQVDNLEILLKNTCQLKCQYCNASFSSSWAKENQTQGLPSGETVTKDFQEKFTSSFWKYLSVRLETLKEINIIGGEPLIQADFFQLLDQVAEIKNKKTSPRLLISVITNLSVSEKHLFQFLQKVEELKSIIDFNLLVSMDNTGARAEYVRFGLDWALFQKNLETVCSTGLFQTIRYVVTMSAFNISDLPALLIYYESLAVKFPNQKFNLISNLVSHPAHLSPLIVDPFVMRYFDECIDLLSQSRISDSKNQQNFSQFLVGLQKQIQQNTSTSYAAERAEFVSWVEHYDSIRQTQFLNTFPEFSAVFSSWKQ